MQKSKRTILIVDDTKINIDILLDLLSDYDVAVAIDGKSAIEIATGECPDLILLDLMMPEMDGFEVCEILKSKDDTKDIPIVFITAKTDEDSIERAYEVGGIDYVVKPFKPRELLARVKTQLKLKELLEHLEFIASHDEMTGIYNRRKFFYEANKKFEDSKEGLFAVMIDIDHFKSINDSYGHPLGDKVIKLITSTIAENILKDCIFGRIGGEEFALLCRENYKDELVNNIESVRRSIEKLEIISDSKKSVKFTISNGIAQADANTKNLDELLKEADIALYKAKDCGRNKVVFR
ncbi:diguanylate cyclase [Sulfurimonas sp.]|uniref:GGDEF domain-containing response regulator n=1 Tax=Sulfurimonas sp. TaxID=2022749 RepID=UPI002AAFF9DF|nr:diguanylate cyclase [Sulfurimonas sp.]